MKSISFLSIVSGTLLYPKILIAGLFIFSYYDNKKFSNDRTKVSLWQLLQRVKSHKSKNYIIVNGLSETDRNYLNEKVRKGGHV